MSLADELLADLEGEDDADFYPEANGHAEKQLDPHRHLDIPMDEGKIGHSNFDLLMLVKFVVNYSQFSYRYQNHFN